MMSKNCKNNGSYHLKKHAVLEWETNPNPDPDDLTNDRARSAAKHTRSHDLNAIETRHQPSQHDRPSENTPDLTALLNQAVVD